MPRRLSSLDEQNLLSHLGSGTGGSNPLNNGVKSEIWRGFKSNILPTSSESNNFTWEQLQVYRR